MADLANEEKPAIAPPVFVFQKDKGQKSSAEQKGLSDSGEAPQGEAESPHHGMGHPESAGEHALELPTHASASACASPLPASEARPTSIQQELAGDRSLPSLQSHAGLEVTSESYSATGTKPPQRIWPHSIRATTGSWAEKALTPTEETYKRSADGSSPEDGEDSDREDGNYCPPVKRERTSSLTQFPPSQSVSKNNVFMPSTFCEPSTGNSDSEPEEKSSGFRLKPPTLIHGQAPSAGLPSQKPKEQQRSVLRPAVLQAPQPKALPQTVPNSGTNGVNVPSDCLGAAPSESINNSALKSSSDSADKLGHENAETTDLPNAGHPSSETPSATNYFLQYISSSLENSTSSSDTSSNKFVFGQNMSERVLSPPKSSEASIDSSKDNTAAESGSESSSLEATPEKESLAESAAAYTKATARKCLLEKVEVITGEEAESNVLQIQCKLFVFDKTSQSWVERGRGLLRLNDMASTDDGTLQSRLVMRTQGSLRLILNTKLWAQMQIDKASEKSIRITAMDTEDQGVKVFLISASSKDTGQLYAALHHRILALRSRIEQEQETKTTAPEPEVTQSNEEDSDDDVLAPSASTGGGTGDEGDGQTVGST
ncbi:ran-binding protein 3 isoform X10 [Monodelphis domestica]|uniref:ran-binding protein 3 isoform X10 n=1 Tax=Monodelphis domestica TaxID=13616 RepID=UPI0024E1EA0B|nr:ran-binding protein 3 isoform X10 [Monodelphis domestica]